MRTAEKILLCAVPLRSFKLGIRVVVRSFIAIALLALAGGIVFAVIPDRAGVIHGCYAAKTGYLRVIDNSFSKCGKDEIALDWSVRGPQGPQGLQGLQGVQGPQGPAGPGPVAFATDSGFNPISITQNTTVVGLTLPAGQYVLSGKLVAGDGMAGNQIDCSLFNSGGGGGPSLLDLSSSSIQTTPSWTTLPLVGSLSLSGVATLSIVCSATTQTGSAFAQYAHLNAVQVATLQQVLPQ